MIIKLDNWILSKEQRKAEYNVYKRFQIEKIERDLHNLFKGKKIILNEYDCLSQRTSSREISCQLKDEELVIIEGVVALSSELLRKISHLKFYCEIDDKLFYQRLRKYYWWKGFSRADIRKLIKNRTKSEYELIKKEKICPDIVIRT